MKMLIRLIDYIFNGKLKLLSRFSIIGVLNTLIDFAAFTIFHSLFGINYTTFRWGSNPT